MVRAFIGIVTRRGLEALHEENDHIVRFLNRRVCRTRRIEGLLWAVMDDDAAEFVGVLLALGELRAALGSLEAYAVHYGAMFPDSADRAYREYCTQPA